MFHDLIYNGRSLSEFGFVLKEAPFYQIAARDIEFEPIPGGNGDEIQDNGGFKNVERVYAINSIPYLLHSLKTPQQIAHDLIDWLYNSDGKYKILRDTYNLGYFCRAICQNPEKLLNPGATLFDTTLNFNCKPFWYSDLGQETLFFGDGQNLSTLNIQLLNPEKYKSEPYFWIRTNGGFTLTVNSTTITVTLPNSNTAYIEIDKELEHVFEGNTTKDQYVTGNVIPGFKSGINNITVTALDGSTSLLMKIIPRWRRL